MKKKMKKPPPTWRIIPVHTWLITIGWDSSPFRIGLFPLPANGHGYCQLAPRFHQEWTNRCCQSLPSPQRCQRENSWLFANGIRKTLNIRKTSHPSMLDLVLKKRYTQYQSLNKCIEIYEFPSVQSMCVSFKKKCFGKVFQVFQIHPRFVQSSTIILFLCYE